MEAVTTAGRAAARRHLRRRRRSRWSARCRPSRALQSLMPDTPIIVYSRVEGARHRPQGDDGRARATSSPSRSSRRRCASPCWRRWSRKRSASCARSGQIPAAATAGTVITVFGAKGGIGKSTISTNLAVSLAQQERASVCHRRPRQRLRRHRRHARRASRSGRCSTSCATST